jgi:DNA-binding response OmpR family regulator
MYSNKGVNSLSGELILLVEDDREISSLIELYLRKQGFDVVVAEAGEEALTQFGNSSPALILLDINLDGMSGFTVCKEIREVSNVPIVFISCNKDSDDIVEGLKMGADDYITKPFDPEVMVARVEANLRRAPIFRRGAAPTKKDELRILSFDGLTVDLVNFQVHVNGIHVPLSAKEVQLLIFLARQPDQVFSLDELYQNIWGADSISDTRTVMVHISSLRKKLETPIAQFKYIHNIRGIGYKFNSYLPKS